MLKKRVIPIVLLDGFSVLKTINFNIRRNLGSPVTVMRTYNTRNVDEMIILDIDASKQGRTFDKFIVKEITNDCFMPLTIGGGIKTLKDIETLLKSGADKISINSFAFKSDIFIKDASMEFGSQCIVASVDLISEGGSYFVYSNGKVITDLNYKDWIRNLISLGAGEILINDVSRDGLMNGANYNLAKEISDMSSIPVIFAGGISDPLDAANLVKHSNVEAIGISSIFHFTDFTPEDRRTELKSLNIPSR